MLAHKKFVITFKKQNNSAQFFESWWRSKKSYDDSKELFTADEKTAWCTLENTAATESLTCKLCAKVKKKLIFSI